MNSSSKTLGFAANEDPFVVARGGFYRRWLSMITDLDELHGIVAQLEATTEDKWVPVWKAAGQRHEERGDTCEARGDHEKAREEYLLAKTFYAIGRFPGEISPVKAEISADCARAYRKASAHLDPPMEIIDGATARAKRTHPTPFPVTGKGQVNGTRGADTVGSDVFQVRIADWAGENSHSEQRTASAG